MNATETLPAQANRPPATHRILIVDDEHAMQLLASAIIKKLGLDPSSASSGEEAVELYRKAQAEGRPYAAVVMDLALPGGISGLEATLAIKQVDGAAKVIVSSGYLEQNARNAALEHGFAGILPKPYTADRLASELRWVLKSGE
jgi:two-component system, cell cycle sensor histidine kinase and response regulator CckA